MRKAYGLLSILLLMFSIAAGQQKNGVPPEICFPGIVGTSSFPAFNKILEKGWGVNTLVNALKQELPHIEVTQNRSARYFGMAKVPLVEYWRVKFAFPANTEVLLAKVHLLMFVYDAATQSEITREIYTAYAVDSIDKDSPEGALAMLKAAFEKCVFLAAQKIADRIPIKGIVRKVTDVIWVDMGKNDGISENSVLEMLTPQGESLGKAKVIDVLSEDCVAYQRGGIPGLKPGCQARLTKKLREINSSEEDVLPTMVPKYVDPFKKTASPNPLKEIKIVQPINNARVYIGTRPATVALEVKGFDVWGDEVALDEKKVKWKVTLGDHLLDLAETAGVMADQPGNYTVRAGYEVWEQSNQVIESKSQNFSAIRIDKLEITPKEIVLGPRENYTFTIAVDGKDSSGRKIEFADIQRLLKAYVEPADMAYNITDSRTLTTGEKPGPFAFKVGLETIAGVEDQAKVLVLPPVQMEILNLNENGKKVKETTLAIAANSVLKLQCAIISSVPQVSADELGVVWNIAEATTYGEVTCDQKRLFFKAGAKGTSIPIKIGVAVANLAANSKRSDTQANLWIQIHAKPPDYYFKLAEELVKSKKYEEAVQALSTVLEINPRYPNAHRNRGRALVKLKRYDDAEKDLGRAIELAPKDNSNYYSLACLYGLQRKTTEAIHYLEAAFKLGFKKFTTIDNDSDLALVRKTREFKALMKRYRKDDAEEEEEPNHSDDE